ncbi:MAG: methionine--tRNA ligase, partial [Candidatus Gastranaerophilales bacterium]|nr:methionine--tRNA ligase [Candidatus Gastranaerophilales bacterium]
FYITTAIDYVNGPPHIGHAYEKIATDVIARHYRQRNLEVFFLTGTDEHGSKIEKTASSKDISPKEFCDLMSDKFKEEWKKLYLSNDRFIRTTDEDHRTVVQHVFKTLLEKGDIYKAAYAGLYCNGCEGFLSERELTEDGLCPDHRTKPQEVQEENYFFRLTKYKEQLKQHILANPNFILPETRVNEVLNQLENTEDISVSRSKESVTWGIPVPGDESQIIYVWIDALSNYLTGVGYLYNNDLFDKFWPANVHMIGKDILKFHSIYWITILMAMELPLPKTILGHGWITVDESKMGKSLGNVVSADYIINEFKLDNPDPVRYYLSTNTSFSRDANYSDEEFKNKVNADLANNLGNLLNRTLSMLVKYNDGIIIPEAITSPDHEIAKLADETKKAVIENFNKYQLFEANETIFKLIDRANAYINEEAPWTLAKNPETQTRCAQVLYNVLEVCRYASILLYPYIPNITQLMWEQLSMEGNVADQKLSALNWSELKSRKITSKDQIKPVFLRLDSELAGIQKKK